MGPEQVTVFAASSLTAAFIEIGDEFMIAHPQVKVTFNFAASSELVAQIAEGAPADVFASADQTNMAKLIDTDATAAKPIDFATNKAAIIVEKGNPQRITNLADLARDDLIVVLCAPQVPCGSYAAEVIDNAAVTVTAKSLEENVKAVVAKVTLGEADAGIVYATDVAGAGTKASGVDIPAELNVVARYPIAALNNTVGAQAFIAFVIGAAGQSILASYGFLAP